jgi:hypothetical protein
MSIFEQIVNQSNIEDKLRENPSSIDNNLIITVKPNKLCYVPVDFDDKLVLTGTGPRKTISDNDFNMQFSKKTYDLLTYMNWTNVVVAGGSIVNIITNSESKLNDIDLFVYGLDKDKGLTKIDHIINSIKQKSSDLNYETRVYMNEHVINIYVFDTKKLLQVQIILRLYDTLVQIMVGFDVDCCCVCWNGKKIQTTQRGLYALKHRVNLASLTRRSPSYENRLIKYSARGFNVVTNFDFKNIYNKLFFMNSNNYGFTRLLEQELINNGQLKNIIFSNTLRLRKTASYTNNYSNYVKYNLEIKNVTDTENCITKYNANMEEASMKFRKYSTNEVKFLQTNVTEQFTGSFNPITNDSWINTTIDSESTESIDELGRTLKFVNLKYNKYNSIDEYENIKLSDMSNFDTKCLAVMYLSNENDIVKIVENKNIPTVTNMYRISPVQLAILLGRTNLALRLMKSHSYETMRELIYMTDNDKLYTTYCNSVGVNYANVDQILVAKYECENISNNIHNQNKEDNFVDEFHKLDEFSMCVKVGTHNTLVEKLFGLKKEQLPFEVFRLLFDKLTSINNSTFTSSFLQDKIIRKFEDEQLEQYNQIMSSSNEKRVLDYVLHTFTQNENKKSVELSENIIKLFKLKGIYQNYMEYSKLSSEVLKINSNLYTCMINIYEPRLNLETINKLLDSKDFDRLFNFILFLDDISLVQKIIPKDDLYVKLKYFYRVSSNTETNVGNFLAQIDKERQLAKIKVNKVLKNSDDHVNAITDGELGENYVRCENIFGMTPDDNIVAKMLLIFNKVINRKDSLNDKDLTTLKTMRKSLANIKRNNEFNKVDTLYFYSQELHNLFFNKDNSANGVVSDENVNQIDKVEQKSSNHNTQNTFNIKNKLLDSKTIDPIKSPDFDKTYESDSDSDCDSDKKLIINKLIEKNTGKSRIYLNDSDEEPI